MLVVDVIRRVATLESVQEAVTNVDLMSMVWAVLQLFRSLTRAALNRLLPTRHSIRAGLFLTRYNELMYVVLVTSDASLFQLTLYCWN
jgi:hypothetical protein